MRAIGVTLIAAIAMMSMPAQAANDTGEQLYISLKRYVDSVERQPVVPDEAKDFAMAQNIGYVLGVWDGIMIARVLAKKDTTCMPAGLSNVALARTVLRHIDAKPGERSISATYVVANALIESYPCLKDSK